MKLKTICIIITVAVLCFIWGNSMLPKSVSSAISDAVAELLGLETEKDAETGISEAGILRKIAHFTEFLALGASLSIPLNASVSDKKMRVVLLLFLGLAVAFIDETIQIFSGRGSTVRDMWIDIAGYVVGCAIVVAIAWAKKRKFAQKET